MKSKKIGIKGIILLLILIAIATISMYAWAKYKSSLQGNVNSQIAKWSFKVKLGETNTIDVLNFPETRTDGNTLVDSNTIAPRNKWKIPNRYRC